MPSLTPLALADHLRGIAELVERGRDGMAASALRQLADCIASGRTALEQAAPAAASPDGMTDGQRLLRALSSSQSVSLLSRVERVLGFEPGDGRIYDVTAGRIVIPQEAWRLVWLAIGEHHRWQAMGEGRA